MTQDSPTLLLDWMTNHQPISASFLRPPLPLHTLILWFHLLSKTPSSHFSLKPSLFFLFSLLVLLPFPPSSTSFPLTTLTNSLRTTLFGSWRTKTNTYLAPLSSSRRRKPSPTHQLIQPIKKTPLVVTLTLLSSMFSSSRTPKLSIARWF